MEATVAHLAGWGRVISGAYGHETIYLGAEEGGEVTGVLPLVSIRSPLFGRFLASMPFLDYGGILAAAGSDAERGLVNAAIGVAEARRASLGLRQFFPTGLPYPVAGEERVTMLLPLASEESVWKALPSERRNRVRKGERNGLTAAWCGPEALDDFYRVFAIKMSELGSPVHSRRFFTLMLEELPGTARILLVRDRGGRTVGAAVCLFFRDTVMVPWPASLREAFALCPNFVLYWEVIRFCCRNGYRVLDLGRSFKNAGTFEFKRQWGGAPRALPWIFVDAAPRRTPSVDRDSSRFGLFVRAWKHLPLPVANLVGPWVRRQVPN
jgi:FemAB-related protein (PEP-CTERM system-associated)